MSQVHNQKMILQRASMHPALSLNRTTVALSAPHRNLHWYFCCRKGSGEESTVTVWLTYSLLVENCRRVITNRSEQIHLVQEWCSEWGSLHWGCSACVSPEAQSWGWRCRAHYWGTQLHVWEMGWRWDMSIHSLYRDGLACQASSLLPRRNVYRNVTHTLHSQCPPLEVSEVPQIHKGHKINLILRNPSVAHGKNPCCQPRAYLGGQERS